MWQQVRPELIVAGIITVVGMLGWALRQIPTNIGEDVREIKESALRAETKADAREALLNTRLARIEQWRAEIQERHRIEDLARAVRGHD